MNRLRDWNGCGRVGEVHNLDVAAAVRCVRHCDGRVGAAVHLERVGPADAAQRQRGAVIQGDNRIGAVRICNVDNMDAALVRVVVSCGDQRVVSAVHTKVGYVQGSVQRPVGQRRYRVDGKGPDGIDGLVVCLLYLVAVGVGDRPGVDVESGLDHRVYRHRRRLIQYDGECPVGRRLGGGAGQGDAAVSPVEVADVQQRVVGGGPVDVLAEGYREGAAGQVVGGRGKRQRELGLCHKMEYLDAAILLGGDRRVGAVSDGEGVHGVRAVKLGEVGVGEVGGGGGAGRVGEVYDLDAVIPI